MKRPDEVLRKLGTTGVSSLTKADEKTIGRWVRHLREAIPEELRQTYRLGLDCITSWGVPSCLGGSCWDHPGSRIVVESPYGDRDDDPWWLPLGEAWSPEEVRKLVDEQEWWEERRRKRLAEDPIPPFTPPPPYDEWVEQRRKAEEAIVFSDPALSILRLRSIEDKLFEASLVARRPGDLEVRRRGAPPLTPFDRRKEWSSSRLGHAHGIVKALLEKAEKASGAQLSLKLPAKRRKFNE